MRAAFLLLLAVLTCACSPKPAASSGDAPTAASTTPIVTVPKGPPWDFMLDPVDKELDHVAESEQLRGKRAIVVLTQSFDGPSMAALRTLEPLLSALPPDTACLLVAIQPLGDRAIVGMFFDGVKHSCRRAIGDPKRNRMGDLARVQNVPAVVILRKDGSVVGGFGGGFTEKNVRDLLAKAE